MIHMVTKEVTTDVGVTLLNSSDVAVNNVAFGDVAVTFRKNGDALYTTKTLSSGQWSEVGDGLYKVTFTSAELNTVGSFRYIVKGASFDRFESDLIVVDEFQSISDQISSIRAALGTKANIRDVDLLFNQLELRQQQVERTVLDITRRLTMAESQLAALRGQ
jgi:hypothetical protein